MQRGIKAPTRQTGNDLFLFLWHCCASKLIAWVWMQKGEKEEADGDWKQEEAAWWRSTATPASEGKREHISHRCFVTWTGHLARSFIHSFVFCECGYRSENAVYEISWCFSRKYKTSPRNFISSECTLIGNDGEWHCVFTTRIPSHTVFNGSRQVLHCKNPSFSK